MIDRKKIHLSILMVTYNRRPDVARCIRSILPQLTPEVEVRVIDNGSTDGTAAMIRRIAPEFHIAGSAANRGLAPALKRLCDAARGRWLLLLDSDTVLPPDAIRRLLAFGDSRPEVGAVAPRMRDADGLVQMTARRFPGVQNAIFGRQTLVSRIWPENSLTRRFLKSREQEGGTPFRCDWVAFAAVLVRARAMREAGGIDSDYFVYWVDADFFRRLQKKGWEVWCCTEVEVLHLEHNRSGQVRSPRAIMDFHRGAFRYCLRHHWFPVAALAAPALLFRSFLHLALNRRNEKNG